MKFCPNCGHEVSEGKQFCHECGEKLSSNNQNGTYQTNNTGYTSYNYTYTPPTPTVSKKNSIIAFVLALVNIEIASLCIFPYVCFLALPGSILLSVFAIIKSNKYVREAGMPNAFSKIGKIVAIVTLVLAGIFFLFGLIYTFDPEMNAMFFEIMQDPYNFSIGSSDLGSSSF